MTIRWCLAALTAWLVSVTAYAQTTSSPGSSQGSLSILSNPSGVVITLHGRQITLAGRTPWRVGRGLEGIYTLVAEAEGYERWTRTIYLDPAASDTLQILLVPKTRAKATLRSMLLPGWGQFYTNQKWKGAIFLGATVIAGVGVYSTNQDYLDARDDLIFIQNRYENADQIDEQERLWREVEVALHRADDAASDRNVAVAVLIGVYALNVLDAFFLFPTPPRVLFSAGVPRSGLFADVGPERVNIGVSVRY